MVPEVLEGMDSQDQECLGSVATILCQSKCMVPMVAIAPCKVL